MKMSPNENNQFTNPLQYNKYFLIFLSYLWFLSSCSTPYVHLPKYDQVHTDPYGAMITVRYKDKDNKSQISTGELLSVENDSIYILSKAKKSYNKTGETHKIVTAHQKKVTSYKVIFAKSEPNGAFLTSGILSLAHGFFLLISIPLNIAVGAVIMSEEKYLYSLSQKELKMEELYQYARFPVGIPQNTDLSELTLRPLHKDRKLSD
jgi:hypothetical protein